MRFESIGVFVLKLLSFMQPDRPDERARIEAAGARVLVVDGARVEGILATSRAIGKYFSIMKSCNVLNVGS